MTRRIGILTSSRADFGIYRPLIDALAEAPDYATELIAFGTHLSPMHGNTVTQIEREGYRVHHQLERCFATEDSPLGVSEAMARTQSRFADFWSRERYDLVFCLGDRYEMFSAVAAGKPFEVNFAHLYGGEQTLGAIDDAFRHAITHLSTWHLAGSEPYAARVRDLTQTPTRVFNAGYLSLDTLHTMDFLSASALRERCGLDLSRPTLLCTFHPETVAPERNAAHVRALCAAFEALEDWQVLITMPNADTNSMVIREGLQSLANAHARISAVENLGSLGYLSAMNLCTAMVGNTSSGFVEASFFPKPVINLGDRQRGRIVTENIVSVPVCRDAIIEGVRGVDAVPLTSHVQIYGGGHAARDICEILRTHVFAPTTGRPHAAD